MITAKVRLTSKVSDAHNPGIVNLTFYADYANGENKAWAYATPYLNLTMGVQAEVAEKLEVGAYTLQFTPE